MDQSRLPLCLEALRRRQHAEDPEGGARHGRGVAQHHLVGAGRQGHVDGAEANRLSKTRGAAPSHVILDPKGTIGRKYEATNTPHMFIVGKDGTLLYMGAIDSIRSANPADIPRAKNYVTAALNEIAAGRKVGEPVTRQYGCSVKYAY